MSVITKYLRFLSTDVRRGWIMCNLIFAAGPVAVALSWGGLDYYPTILSYCYALLVVGSYLFYRNLKSHKEEENEGNEHTTIIKNIDTIFWTSLVAAIVLLYLLSQYSSGAVIDKAIHFHASITAIVSLIVIVISFVMAYKLNLPMIYREELADGKAKRPYEDAEDAAKSVKDTKETIEKVAEEADNGN